MVHYWAHFHSLLEELGYKSEEEVIYDRLSKIKKRNGEVIAATAQVHDLTVVTRNTQDMEGSGVAVMNPWTYESNT